MMKEQLTAALVAKQTNCAKHGVAISVFPDYYFITSKTGIHSLAISFTDQARLTAHVKGFIANQGRAS